LLNYSNDLNDPIYGTYNFNKDASSACDVVAFDAVEEWYPGAFHHPTVSYVTC